MSCPNRGRTREHFALIKLAPCSGSALGRDALLEQIRECGPDASTQTLTSMALLLQRACLEPDFLAEWVLSIVRDPNFGEERNPYDVTSLMLARLPYWVVRANVWYPVDSRLPRWAQRAASNIYDIAHNHDQPLITCCSLGEGYETLYARALDGDDVAGVGDRVQLAPVRKERLGLGEAMIYEPFVDYHAQLAPQSICVTVNLIRTSPRPPRSSHSIDLDSGLVTTQTSSAPTRRSRASRALARLGQR